jgi:hypothetical protein
MVVPFILILLGWKHVLKTKRKVGLSFHDGDFYSPVIQFAITCIVGSIQGVIGTAKEYDVFRVYDAGIGYGLGHDAAFGGQVDDTRSRRVIVAIMSFSR